MNPTGTVYWITGLSGAGKTTLATRLVAQLKMLAQPTVFLDGDVMREIFDTTTNLNRNERFLLSMKYAKLCHALSNQGFNVVCATISLFHETQAWNRENIHHYFEVFLQVPLAELMRRDPKKIYAKANAGTLTHVVGLDIPAEFPMHPDLILNHEDKLSTEEAVDQIIHLSHHRLQPGEKHESSCL
jgi:adenylylsulfate kinase-like enzyme